MNRECIVQRKQQAAFTLIELIVVLAIMGVVLITMVPRIGNIYDRQLVEQQIRILENELIWLRSEAQYNGEPAVFQCIDRQHYALTVKKDGTLESEVREVIDTRLTLQSNSQEEQITFYATGCCLEKCTLTVQCGKIVRTLVVNDLGRIRIGEKQTTAGNDID